MSERGRSMPTLSERAEEEVTLDAAQEEMLRDSLRTLPMPLASERFNARLTGAIRSGHDFRPLKAQLVTRLRWMCLPTVLGFAVTWGLAQAGVGFQAEEATIEPATVRVVPAPPLPPLQMQLIPAPRPIAKSTKPPQNAVPPGMFPGGGLPIGIEPQNGATLHSQQAALQAKALNRYSASEQRPTQTVRHSVSTPMGTGDRTHSSDVLTGAKRGERR